MTKKPRPDPPNQEELQEAFNESCPENLVQTEPYGGGHSHMADSIIAIHVATVQVDLAPADPGERDAQDDKQIKAIITCWETADPLDLPKVFDKHAANSMMVIDAGRIGSIQSESMIQGMASDKFERNIKDYPRYTPRKVNLSHWRITYMSPAEAVVTYHFREQFTNKEQLARNAFGILFKDEEDQWKLAALTLQFGR